MVTPPEEPRSSGTMETNDTQVPGIRERLEAFEERLSPFASRSHRSQGREYAEDPSPMRTEFQRDRDRIIHSKAFRRLKHKTQVFIAPTGDHYVTRLTHSLEVAQIGRTIARALNLNEDLVEAMSNGHDLGHTPFGHIGEDTLNQLASEGFAHSVQSLRIVERLEKEGRGLNLTWEVRQGIVCHSKPQGDFLDENLARFLTLEGQILRLADSVAYLNHDIADAFRAGMLTSEDLPEEVNRILGTTHSQRIDALVTDIVTASWAATGEASNNSPNGEPPKTGEPPVITMSDDVRGAMNSLRAFMFQEVYLPLGRTQESEAAREIIRLIFNRLLAHPEGIPAAYFYHEETAEQAAIDFLSGMTDHYAIRLAEELRPGISRGIFDRVPLV